MTTFYPVPDAYPLIESPCWCGCSQATPVCRRDRFGQALRAVLCERCGTIRLNPYLSAADAVRYYTREYLAAGYNRSFQERFADREASSSKVAELAPLLAPGSTVLDYGCGCGGVSNRFLAMGHSAYGHELSLPALDFALGTGLRAHEPGRIYDAIVLYHSLEHHVDPNVALSEIASLAKPGGLLYIAVPMLNRLIAGARQQGLEGEVYFPHRWYFSLDGLDQLLAQWGFARVQSDAATDSIYSKSTKVPSGRPIRGSRRARIRLALIQGSARVITVPLLGRIAARLLWACRGVV